jgi:hypothetical protein
MKIAKRWLHLLMMLCLAWLTMTTTHEVGHIVSGLASGGVLRHADLWPWHLPFSLFEPHPHPLITLWMGPVLGVSLPVGLAMVIRRKWSWFVANFCILANGCYLATAWITGDRFLDTAQLLAAGAWPVSVFGFCAVTILVGYVRFRESCVEIFSQPDIQRNEELTKAQSSGKRRRSLFPAIADFIQGIIHNRRG